MLVGLVWIAALSVGGTVDENIPHALLVPTGTDLAAAYEAGQRAAAALSEDKVIGLFREDIGHVRSREGWPSSSAHIRCDLVDTFLSGYLSQKNELPAAEAGGDPTNPERPCLEFAVDMYSWPGVTDYGGTIVRFAFRSEAESVGFELRTQDGRRLSPLGPPARQATDVYFGAVGEGTERGWVDFDPGGTPEDELFGAPYFHAYHARYFLRFALYDGVGKPIAAEKTPRLILVTKRASGTQETTIDLDRVVAAALGKPIPPRTGDPVRYTPTRIKPAGD
jgi:hypothetical protein